MTVKLSKETEVQVKGCLAIFFLASVVFTSGFFIGYLVRMKVS